MPPQNVVCLFHATNKKTEQVQFDLLLREKAIAMVEADTKNLH
jgi:hypothetical protein